MIWVGHPLVRTIATLFGVLRNRLSGFKMLIVRYIQIFFMLSLLVSCGGGKKSATEGVPDLSATPVVVLQPDAKTDEPAGTPSGGGGVINTGPGIWAPTLSIASSTVRSGESVEITLTLKDQAGSPYPSKGLVVTFDMDGGTSTGTLAPTTSEGSGIFKSSFTGVLVGTPKTISAQVSGALVSTTLPTVAVVHGAVSHSASLVTISQSSIVSGSTATVTIAPRDAAGNSYTTDNLTVSLSAVGVSMGTFSAPSHQVNGTYTAIMTATAAGSASTVAVSINGSAVATALPSFTVSPGAASPANSLVTISLTTVAAGLPVNATMTAFDAFGNRVNVGGATVTFGNSVGTSTVVPGPTSDVGDGTYTSVLVGDESGTASNITAQISGVEVATSLPQLTVTPGAFSTSQSTFTAWHPLRR